MGRIVTLNDVTVVIPSFGRHGMLQKQIAFFELFQTPLIIVDGSPEKLVLKEKMEVKGSKIKYIHCPGEKNFIERVAKGLEAVRTDFFCLMDDSDIVLPSSLIHIAQWLKEHPDFCATGQVYRILNEQQLFAIQNWGHWSNPLDLEDEKLPLNFCKAIPEARTGNLVYLVCPTPFRKTIIPILRSLQLRHEDRSIYLFEQIFASVVLANYRVKKVSIPFWFRCDTTPNDVERVKTSKNLPLDSIGYQVWRNTVEREIFSKYLDERELMSRVLQAITSLELKMTQVHSMQRESERNPLVRTFINFLLKSKVPLIAQIIRDRQRRGRLDWINQQQLQRNEFAATINQLERKLARELEKELRVALSCWLLSISPQK